MKNILFVSWYTGLGGGETDLLELAKALDPDEYRAHLLLPRDDQLGAKWRDLGLPVHFTHWRGASVYFIPALWMRFPVVQRIATIIREQQIDLVHSDYHTLPMTVAAARQANVPLMWTVHGWWFKPKFWQRSFFRSIETAVARSYSIRDGFLGEPPFIPPERLPVIYSGIDTTRFHPQLDESALRTELNLDADTPLVVMVARFQPVKGHHTFQAMARLVLEQIPDAHFVVAGGDVFGVAADEAYKQSILAQAQADPVLRERLHYIGFRDDVERVLAAADVLVCASEFESYGKANLEAMACATPVVSSNRGGPAETVVQGETGYLVDPANIPQMATYVIDLLRNPQMRGQMGQNGRKRIESLFSATASLDAYRQIFQKLT